MSDSPSEYIEELREQNRTLRANLVAVVREKQMYEEALARLVCDHAALKRLVMVKGD